MIMLRLRWRINCAIKHLSVSIDKHLQIFLHVSNYDCAIGVRGIDRYARLQGLPLRACNLILTEHIQWLTERCDIRVKQCQFFQYRPCLVTSKVLGNHIGYIQKPMRKEC